MNERQSVLFPSTSKTLSTLNVLQGLPRSEIGPLAAKVLRTVEPWCTRVELAGSFRRQRETVNDLDVVVQPCAAVGSWVSVLRSLREEFDAITVKQGDKLATLYLPFASSKGQGHVQVDLYRAEPQTWGILLLVRTGSKEHNVKLCNLAIARGLRLKYSVGLVDDAGNVVAGRTEEEVFQALGLAYVEPKDREVTK